MCYASPHSAPPTCIAAAAAAPANIDTPNCCHSRREARTRVKGPDHNRCKPGKYLTCDLIRKYGFEIRGQVRHMSSDILNVCVFIRDTNPPWPSLFISAAVAALHARMTQYIMAALTRAPHMTVW